MSALDPPRPPAWPDAALAATLFAIDPLGTGGVSLRALAGPVRDRWLALVRELLPPAAPVRRLPLHVGDGRLLGGLDLAATLEAGRPIAERGILAETDGGVLLLAMAERLGLATAARLTAVLDTGEVQAQRDGLALRHPARLGVVALDEGMADDERPPAALLDRLAFRLDLHGIGARDAADQPCGRGAVLAARDRLSMIVVEHEVVDALCTAATVLGIGSVRAPLLALKVARAAAALAGRDQVGGDDAALAGRLVLAPRATMLPAADAPVEPAPDERPPAEDDSPAPGDVDPAEDTGRTDATVPLDDIVLAAAQAAIPAGLLARLRLAGEGISRHAPGGKAGAARQTGSRGRPAGVRRGEPRGSARLNVIETLRAAAPWQALRRGNRGCDGAGSKASARDCGRIEVRRDDFRIGRFKERSRTTTIFVVDASGSAAFHRLAEAKGAVELLLADCYVRRDQVALLAFRGRSAEILLPPTRSLVRAKRSLAELAGGGGTPLALGIDSATALADAVRRRGETPIVILLTDGRANIARDGAADRARAEEEAVAAARRVAAQAMSAILVDTSPRPKPQAQGLAAAMRALYLPLPYADSAALAQAVRTAAPRSSPGGARVR